MASGGVPIIFTILAKKDASVERVVNEVRTAFEGLTKVETPVQLPKVFEDAADKIRDASLKLEEFRSALKNAVDTGADAAGIRNLTAGLKDWALQNTELLASAPGLRREYSLTFAAARDAAKDAERAAREFGAAQKAAAVEAEAAARTVKTAGDEAARAQQKSAAEASKAAQQAKRDADQSLQGFKTAATAAGLAASAAGASLLGLAGAALTASAGLEPLRARFLVLKGSLDDATKAYANAVQFAANTGFELKGVLQAALQLDTFKQKVEEVLPRVAALAAGTGRDIQSVSAILSRFGEGDERSVAILGRQFDITAADIKRFGGVVDESTGKLRKGEDALEKNRQAVLRLLDAKYGNAVAAQANTLVGGLQRAKNSVTLLADSFGQELAPAASLGLQGFNGLVNGLNTHLSPAFKALVGVTAVVAGSVLSVGGAATLAVVGLTVLNSQLASTAANSAAAAVGLRATGGALALANGAAGFASKAFAYFTGTVGGLTIGLLGLAAAIAEVSFAKLEAEARAAGKTIEEDSKKAQDASQQFRGLIDTINKAGSGKGINLKIESDITKQIDGIRGAFAKLGKEDVVRAFQSLGASSEDIAKKLEQVEAQSKRSTDRFTALTAAIDNITEARKKFLEAQKQTPEERRETVREAEQLKKHAADTLRSVGLEAEAQSLDIKDLTKAQEGYRTELNQLAGSRQILRFVIQDFKDFADPLNAATEKVKQLKPFLEFSKEVGSAKALKAALAEVQAPVDMS